MLKTYKNPEYIYSLSNKELKDYYDCYSHHHFNRHFCKSDNQTINSSCFDRSCPCYCNSDEHYCTTHGENLEESTNEPSLIVCEHFVPSYTSKMDQINDIKKDIGNLKKSKLFMKQAMKELDEFLDKKPKSKENLNEVEEFYRSNKFIGSSLNVKSLQKNLPRTDIKPAKYIIELNEQNEYPIYGSALFSYDNKQIFADKELVAKEEKLKILKKPFLKPRPKTSVVFCKEK